MNNAKMILSSNEQRKLLQSKLSKYTEWVHIEEVIHVLTQKYYAVV